MNCNRKAWFSRAFGTVLTASGFLMQTAHADIKYTMVMKMADGKVANSTTKYVRQGAQRDETNISMGPVQMKQVSLRLCEKDQYIQLDPKLKIYAVLDQSAGGGGSATGGTPGKPASAPATGKMTVTTNVKELAPETIAGFKTRHYMITMSMVSSGCAGNSNTNMKSEIWVADIKDASPCKAEGFDPKNYAGPGRSDCKITYEQKGDVAAVSKAYNGLIMRMKMYDGDKVTATQEVTMLSQAKLDNDPFVIPADYKKVSSLEFQQAQSRAMMEAMTTGANSSAKNDAEADDNENDSDANEGNTENDGGMRGNEDGNTGGMRGNEDGNTGGMRGNDGSEEKEKKEEEQPKKKKNPFGKFKLPF
jgi:hypothetical protein